MLSSNDIRDIKFSKSVGGYKQDEVDVLLDKVEADYEQYERTVRDLQGVVESLKREIEGYKSSQNSIQNVLLSAQKLADQIVEEARVKSDAIIREAQDNVDRISLHERELVASFEEKANQRKAQIERELEETYKTAEAKKKSIDAATVDSVTRQQMLFEKLKLEVVAFKAEIKKKYKEHLELLQSIPDEVPMDPKVLAETLSLRFDKAPDVDSFVFQSTETDVSSFSDEPITPVSDSAFEVVNDDENVEEENI
ncbi:MAG: DivIVA domain-containing protein [Ruminococcaceae bacterium]|nr:DivIVA domain-containing protein [Oscillospiraceae bacterium]